ncbi:unnamed protein product [Thelazia callipaeda]|uniref:Rho-GAP domain-containing protein n=1 Tax=Thelazia callipaeda TaxID=103827 RepID=A0A0N5CXX2_THECL|nr:unnamed protein product [Thelazia callipaeda]
MLQMVPLIIRLCVKVVESHGMDTVGIYRIPGNTAAVNALKETLNGELTEIDLADPKWNDVNVVSSLLKMFLRKLPEPLLTDKLYPFFIDANRITSHAQRLRKLRNLVHKLPLAHYETLKYLMGHLKEVVAHSDINKMETRNLALMFGPSIVRPSDDNMATMVTHMSDQCKIVEAFITYHNWMFGEICEDDVPPQVAPSDSTVSSGNISGVGSNLTSSIGDYDAVIMTTSFNDMHNLIRRANEVEATAMMDAQKYGKIKNILNVRRNSKRDKRKKVRDHSAHAASNTPSSSCNMRKLFKASASQPTATASFGSDEHTLARVYQERDIDAEIALRKQQRTPTRPMLQHSGASSSADHSCSRSRSSATHDVTPPLSLNSSRENSDEADEMRRRRQKEMYSARRIFIAGTDADLNDNVDLDDLMSHSRHLNLASSPALDVLSAETREKIRRLQQLQGWATTALERRDAEGATNKKYPPVQKTQTEVKLILPIKTATEDFSSTDALSLTSDYSTTSSAPLTIPVTVSCIDHLTAASSDYASSDVSPNTRNVSTSPSQVDLEVLGLNSSPTVSDHFKHSQGEEMQMSSSTTENCYKSLENVSLEPLLITPTKHSENQSKGGFLGYKEMCKMSVPQAHEISFSNGSKVKARMKLNSRRELWRRHTLSDMDIVKQVNFY